MEVACSSQFLTNIQDPYAGNFLLVYKIAGASNLSMSLNKLCSKMVALEWWHHLVVLILQANENKTDTRTSMLVLCLGASR